MENNKEGQSINELLSVGQEFIEWAEKYWHIQKLLKIENPDIFNGKVCDYNYMRKVFMDKINSIIIDRVGI